MKRVIEKRIIDEIENMNVILTDLDNDLISLIGKKHMLSKNDAEMIKRLADDLRYC